MKYYRVLACILLGCTALIAFFFCLSVETVPCNPTWLRVATVMKDLRIAIGNFQADYHTFPGQPHQAQVLDQRTQSTGLFIDCLLEKNKEWNPREIMYMDLPPARDGKGGYIPANGSTPAQLVDPWGSPYVILLDTSGDSAIANPDLKNSDPQVVRHLGVSPPPTLPTDVVIFSLGKDKVEGTGDDIVSWRTWGTGAYDVADSRSKELMVVVLAIGVMMAWFYSKRSKVRGSSSAAAS